MTNGSLIKVKGIAEYSPWSILQYFSGLENQFFVFLWVAILHSVVSSVCVCVRACVCFVIRPGLPLSLVVNTRDEGLRALHGTIKPVLNGHSQKDQKMFFKTDYRLMKVESIAECSKRSILQYFRPSLSYHIL